MLVHKLFFWQFYQLNRKGLSVNLENSIVNKVFCIWIIIIKWCGCFRTWELHMRFIYHLGNSAPQHLVFHLPPPLSFYTPLENNIIFLENFLSVSGGSFTRCVRLCYIYESLCIFASLCIYVYISVYLFLYLCELSKENAGCE